MFTVGVGVASQETCISFTLLVFGESCFSSGICLLILSMISKAWGTVGSSNNDNDIIRTEKNAVLRVNKKWKGKKRRRNDVLFARADNSRHFGSWMSISLPFELGSCNCLSLEASYCLLVALHTYSMDDSLLHRINVRRLILCSIIYQMSQNL
jgi:hypothetical protein